MLPLSITGGDIVLKRLKMLVSIGSSEGWTYTCGQTAEIEADLADKWIKAGIAEDTAPECSAILAPETARMPAPKPKSGRR